MTPAQHRARVRAILGRLRRASSSQADASSPAAGQVVDPDRWGTLEPTYLANSIQAIMPLVKECYGLAGKPRGRLVVHLEIVADPDLGGLVAESTIDEDRSNVVSPTMRECIRETMYALELDPPTGGGRAKVAIPITNK
jgi:hypothetical protein